MRYINWLGRDESGAIARFDSSKEGIVPPPYKFYARANLRGAHEWFSDAWVWLEQRWPKNWMDWGFERASVDSPSRYALRAKDALRERNQRRALLREGDAPMVVSNDEYAALPAWVREAIVPLHGSFASGSIELADTFEYLACHDPWRGFGDRPWKSEMRDWLALDLDGQLARFVCDERCFIPQDALLVSQLDANHPFQALLQDGKCSVYERDTETESLFRRKFAATRQEPGAVQPMWTMPFLFSLIESVELRHHFLPHELSPLQSFAHPSNWWIAKDRLGKVAFFDSQVTGPASLCSERSPLLTERQQDQVSIICAPTWGTRKPLLDSHSYNFWQSLGARTRLAYHHTYVWSELDEVYRYAIPTFEGRRAMPTFLDASEFEEFQEFIEELPCVFGKDLDPKAFPNLEVLKDQAFVAATLG